MDQDNVTRRSVVRGAGLVGLGIVGAGTLAACGSSDTPAPGGSPTTSSAASSAASSTTAGGASDGATVKTADVPVGGGTIIAAALVVVTQPKAGEFKAFSAICTHQRCPVTQVANGTIDCPCHGSMYDIATGAVVTGPATSPLTAMTATVSGDTVTVS